MARFRALPNATVWVEGEGRTWRVFHSTVPSGGTHVDAWRRRSRAAALRKARRVQRAVDEAQRRKALWRRIPH